MIVQTIAEVGRPRRFINRRRHPRRVQRLDLAGNKERTVAPLMIVERFDAKAIARRKQALLAFIPD